NRHGVTNAAKAGTSEISKVSQPEDPVTLSKCKKSNNDGLCDGVTDAKGGTGEKTRLDLVAHFGPQSTSSDPVYTGPVVAVPDLGPDRLDEPGKPVATNGSTDTSFTQHRIRELGRWCLDRAEAQRQARGGEFDQSVIERDLRIVLWQEAVDAGEVERAFEAVMKIVFT